MSLGPSAWRRPRPIGSDFQRKFRRLAEEEKEAHHKSTRMKLVTPRANHARRKGGNLTGAGTHLPERGQALYYQSGGVVGCQPPTPSVSSPKKQLQELSLSPRGVGHSGAKPPY